MTLSLAAIRNALVASPLAQEALTAAVDLGHARSPLALYQWARRQADDTARQVDDRRAAAAMLADCVASAVLGGSTWKAAESGCPCRTRGHCDCHRQHITERCDCEMCSSADGTP